MTRRGRHIIRSGIALLGAGLLVACASAEHYSEKMLERTHFNFREGVHLDWIPASFKEQGYDVDLDMNFSKVYLVREIKFPPSRAHHYSEIRYAPPPPREAPEDYVILSAEPYGPPLPPTMTHKLAAL